MRDANEISGKSPLNEIISDEKRTLSRDSSFSSREREREILSPQNSPRRRIICRMLVNLMRSFSVSIQSVCNRDSDIYFRLEQAEVKYGKNICLSDGIFGS